VEEVTHELRVLMLAGHVGLHRRGKGNFPASIETRKLIGRHFIALLSAPSLPVWVTSRWSNIAGADVRIIRLREGWRGNNDRGQSHRGEEFVHVTSQFRVVGD